MLEKRPPQAVLITDKGLRERNEDYVGYAVPTDEKRRDRGALFVLADGMGGHQAGDVASRAAVEAIKRAYMSGNGDRPPVERLARAVEQANDEVYQMAARKDTRSGMGTTMVAVVLQGRKLCIAHVGDSRAYVLHRDNETFERVTKDHSYVQELIDQGELDPEDAEFHPERKVVTRCLGRHEGVVVDTSEMDLEPGDVVLLCSDGLTRPLTEEVIADTLTRQPLDKAALDLLQQATIEGQDDPDNVSVVAFEVPGATESPLPTPLMLKSPTVTRPYGRYLSMVGTAMALGLVALLFGGDAFARILHLNTNTLISTQVPPATTVEAQATLKPPVELLQPPNNMVFYKANTIVTLSWKDPLGRLGDGELYVVEILPPGRTIVSATTTATSYQVPLSFYNPTAQGYFHWSVYRVANGGDSKLIDATSESSALGSFAWIPTGPPPATETATPTKTRPSQVTPTPTHAPVKTTPPTPSRTPTPLKTATPVVTQTLTSGGGTSTPTVYVPLPPVDSTTTPSRTATTKPGESTPTNAPVPPTHTAVATSTPEPTDSHTRKPSSKTGTPLPISTDTLVPTDTSVPTSTETLVPTNTPTNTPIPTDTSVPTSTETLVPTNTPTSTGTDTRIPTHTHPTRTPTNTRAPTDTPDTPSTNTPVSDP